MELSLQAAVGPPAVALHGWSSPEAEAAFERARQLAESLGQSEQLPPVLWGLWSYYLVRGKQIRAMSMAEQVLERALGDHQSELNLTAHWTVGISSVVLGRFEQARHHLTLVASNYDENTHREMIYRYGQSPGVTCTFWLALSQWFLGEREAALTPKAVALLEYMMTHPDELLTRERLLDAVWGWDYPAGTRTVDTRIAELRRVLGDDPSDPRYVETVPGQGYRFVAGVEAKS